MPKRVKPETHMAQKLRYNERGRKYAYNNHGRWRAEEKTMVLAHAIPDRMLAKAIGRSIQAIHAVRNREEMKGGIYV